MKNKYCKGTHISERKFRGIIRCFGLDLSATDTTQMTGISRRTINKIFQKLRLRIASELSREEKIDGVLELDESYFGARRVKGKRGRGARGKIPVFGILERDGRVYTKIVNNCSKKELMPIIRGKILEGSTINTDGWKSYDGLILDGYKHYRVYHSKDEFARGKCHINGIESFWSFAKRRLAKFNGTKKNFYFHLKECEFRFNFRKQNLYVILLKILREKSL